MEVFSYAAKYFEFSIHRTWNIVNVDVVGLPKTLTSPHFELQLYQK